jgi:RNA polymerase sigma factor (sigma-70 family)
VFNVALRMVYNADDAADVAQDVIVKLLTRLASFEGRSSFRTWLYRVTANHVINMKARKAEKMVSTFSAYGDALDGVPDLDPPDERSAPVDVALLLKEAKVGCMMGMLLCLSREQRVVYILGELFGITDAVGAEVLDVTPANFRQKLSRARRDLYSFMNDKCGLVRESNPCRCARKTRGFIEAGIVDANRLRFAGAKVERLRDAAPARSEQLDELEAEYAGLFRDHGLYDAPDAAGMVRDLLASPDVQQLFDLH